jgi:hypothetical protein
MFETQLNKWNAAMRLQATDYVVISSLERQKTLSADWLAWREILREAARGKDIEIPAEPERYSKL